MYFRMARSALENDSLSRVRPVSAGTAIAANPSDRYDPAHDDAVKLHLSGGRNADLPALKNDNPPMEKPEATTDQAVNSAYGGPNSGKGARLDIAA